MAFVSLSAWNAAAAGVPEFTPAQKAAFDRTTAAAEPARATKLADGLREFEELRKSAADWDRKTSELHYRSEEALIAARKKAGKFDEAKVAKLKLQVDQAKERYKPLFDLYRSVNSQLEIARKVKNKTLTSALRAQADAMKITVQLARQDIRGKDDDYQTAKKAAAAKTKKVRDTLSAIAPLQVQIRAAKSALGAPKESRWTVWKSFVQALNKKDGKTAADLLASVNSLSRQIVERQIKIHELESRIDGIIRTAEAQLAQSASG